MVRRSPQKKKNKAGPPKPDSGLPGTAEVVSTQVNEDAAPTAVNWLSSSGAAPSLAPNSEPWTPTGHKNEWSTARSPLRSPTKPLEQQVSSLQAQREAADADLWNARVELQDHAQQKEADQERIAKLSSELAKLRSEYEYNSQALDELRSREGELQSHLERERAKAARDRQNVREQLEDRDGFIENLQSQLDEVREELKATTRAAALLRRQNVEDTSGDISSGAGDITSITVDSDVNVGLPEPSEVPQTLGGSELLSQTHHARQQRSLRAALQKQRLENFQLKQQIAELKGAPAPHWEEDEAPVGGEHLSDEASPNELEPSASSSEFFTDAMPPEVPEIPIGVPLSEDFDDAAQLQHDTSHLNLAVSPGHELSEPSTRHPDETSIDALTTELRKKYDAHVVPSDEFEALKNPGMDLLHHQANALNHRLVPIREYEEMRNTQATSAKLQLTDKELRLAYELLRGRRRSKSKVHSHVLQDLARNQALGLAPDVSHHYGDTSRDPSVSPSRTGHQRTQSHSSSMSDPESFYGDAQSSNGVGAALRQIAQNHGFELVSDTVAGSRELAQRHGLITVPLESLAVLSDTKIVPGENAPSSQQVNDVVLSLSREDADRIQEQLAAAPPSISKEELSELQRRAYTPTSADLTEQAAALGMAVLPLEAVAEMKGQLRQRSVPDASTVAVMAEKAGLRVIPQHPTLDELRDFAPEDAVLVERETWAALEYPEPATLRRLAKVHGLAVLPEKEVERLQHSKLGNAEPTSTLSSPPPTDKLSIDQLREAAQSHDLVVLSADDYREILASRQTRDFSHLPMAARTEHFEKLIRSSQEARTSATSPRGSPSASSLGSLSDRITRLGFVPVEQEEYQRLLASQKVYEPTKSDILRSAKQFGLAVMPVEDALRLRSSHWNSPNKSTRDTSFSASTGGSPVRDSSPLKTDLRGSNDEDEFEGFKAVPTEYLAALRRIVEHPTRADVEGIARKAGLTVGPSTLNDEEVIQRAKELSVLKPPTEDDLHEFAKSKGYFEPSNVDDVVARAKELGLVEPLSDDRLREKGKTLGLVENPSDDAILARAEQLGHTKPLSAFEIHEKARDLGLILSDDQILEKAKVLGLVEPPSDLEVLEKAKDLGLDEPLSDADILEKARHLGLVEPPTNADIVEKAKQLGLVDSLSEKEILEQAKDLGLAEPLADNEILEKAKLLGLVEPLTETDIVDKAKNLGLVEPLSDLEILKKARNLGLVDPPSDADIVDKAKRLGLIEPLSEKDILERAKHLGLAEHLTEDEIFKLADTAGLKPPPSTSDIMNKARSLGLVDPLSESQVIQKARSLGLSEPLHESQILERAKTLGLIEPYSEDQILKEGKALGLVEPISDDEVVLKAKALGLNYPPSKAETLDNAKSLGLVEPLDNESLLQRAKHLGLVSPPSDSEIRDKAKSLGLVEPMSDSELRESAKVRLGLVQAPNDKEVVAKAQELGLAYPLSENKILESAKSKGLVEPYTDTQIREEAKKLGMIDSLDETEFLSTAEVRGLTKPYTDSQVRDAAKTLGLVEPLSESELLNTAKSMGLVEPYSDSQIRSEARKLGLVEPLSESELIQSAKSKGLVEPYSDAQILDAARKLGLVERRDDVEQVKSEAPAKSYNDEQILKAAKAKGLVEPLSDIQLREAGINLGLIEPLSDSQIIEFAKAAGLTDPLTEAQVREAGKSQGLVEPPTKSQVIEAAKRYGLVEPPSVPEIKEAAQRHGLVAPYSDTEVRAAAKKLGLTDPLTDADILRIAKSKGLVEPVSQTAKPHKAAESIHNGKSDTLGTAASPVGHAEGAGLPSDTIPTTHDHDLRSVEKEHAHSKQTSEVPTDAAAAAIGPRGSQRLQKDNPSTSPVNRKPVGSSNATANKPTKDTPPPIPERVRSDRGPPASLNNATDIPNLAPKAFSSALSESSDGMRGDPSVVYGPEGPGKATSSGLPQRLGGSPMRRSLRNYELAGATRSPNKGMTRSNTGTSLHGHLNRAARGSQSSTRAVEALNLPVPSSSSFRRHGAQAPYAGSVAESVGSSWAVETVTGEAAELNVSQIIVGEVLHKYTSGFNFEGITGGRHKRYFWFRPESMTLYWHRENPHFLAGLYGPAKCITVVGVEEIPDRNPIPAGLFHRSILIKGRERDLRVTCSTAARHQVWYSTLRYILTDRSEHVNGAA